MDELEGDTIAAISTAPGVGAIAVIRVSGPRAFEILEALAPELGPVEPKQIRLATIRDPADGRPLDQAVVVYNRAPDSYTGEHLVEISGHGGWLGPRLILEACIAAGAREAARGEFTRRAYLNGRMDLVQAEAVADLIDGRSTAARRAALHQLDRGLSRRIAQLRDALLGLEAMLVHHLDFPDEDEPPVSVTAIADRAEDVVGELRTLLSTAAEGELLREGAMVVLAGRPNSGKSSLFNALLGSERAIVTDVPGTTRDALEAVVSLGGFPFRLVDTAGLRETADGIERLGIEVAHRYLGAADVIVLCVESGRALGPDEIAFLENAGGRVLLARTKSDIAAEATPDPSEVPSQSVAAMTGAGLAELRGALARLAYERLLGTAPDAPVLTRARQARGVKTALEEIQAFARELREGTGPEVAAARLRPAETALEELLGVITPEDVLDRVFADFCIGK
jgi:tRNA modification GTPase